MFKNGRALEVPSGHTVAQALAAGGVLLWKRRPWGFVVAPIATIQGALYLVVLSLNSAVAIGRGLAAPPGELPVWAPLAAFTSVAAMVLLGNASGGGRAHGVAR